jgi:hypothetical protein
MCIMDGRPEFRKLKTLAIARMRLLGSWLVLLTAGRNLYGQSCAMCYTTVAGGGKSFIHALRGGIIVLLIPPVLLFLGLTILLFRWRSASSRACSFEPRDSADRYKALSL